MHKAYFFDMDGVLFDSMPNHAAAWEQVMSAHGLRFTARDCYLQEGRTGQDVINEAILHTHHRPATEDEIHTIYREKSDAFHARGGALPMRGIHDVLHFLRNSSADGLTPQIWIVTGSGQQTLFDTLEQHFPGVFTRAHMVTAFDVTHGKPDPEPYLRAWQGSGLPKADCCVIENAPLGIRAAKAAGLYAIGVNTGPLLPEDLAREGADLVLPDMPALLHHLRQSV
ncbi:MAG: HAD-IA family hydrolase [Paludibacteraceae bacterium]|nr:HAD-IA family hydrolase [Paludibacteraceae bacterium]